MTEDPRRVSYIVYDPITGRIDRYGTAREDWVSLQAQPGEVALEASEVVTDATHYVDAGLPVPRPTLTVPTPAPIQTFDEYVISELPVGTVVRVGSDAYTIDDGEFVFTTDEPGSYPLTIELPFPHAPDTQVVTITVEEASAA